MDYKTKSETQLETLWTQEREQLKELMARVAKHEPILDLVDACMQLREQAMLMEQEIQPLPPHLLEMRAQQRNAFEETVAAIELAKHQTTAAKEELMRELRKTNDVRKVLTTYRR